MSYLSTKARARAQCYVAYSVIISKTLTRLEWSVLSKQFVYFQVCILHLQARRRAGVSIMFNGTSAVAATGGIRQWRRGARRRPQGTRTPRPRTPLCRRRQTRLDLACLFFYECHADTIAARAQCARKHPTHISFLDDLNFVFILNFMHFRASANLLPSQKTILQLTLIIKSI